MNILKFNTTFSDPPIARFLFSDKRAAWLWLPLRLWLGWDWLSHGLQKTADPKWVSTGESLKGYWLNAVKIPESGRPPISFDWYRDFINMLLSSESYTWFAKLVAYGEVLIGIGLLVGGLVGIAAFFGALMNWSFIMAGSASTNGLLLVIALALMLAWKVAGLIGADFFLLRYLGVPWKVDPEKAPASGSKGMPLAKTN